MGAAASFSLSTDELSTLTEDERKEYESILSNLTEYEKKEFSKEFEILKQTGAPTDECISLVFQHYKTQKNEKESIKNEKEAFVSADLNKDGVIDALELAQHLTNTKGENVDIETAQAIIAAADQNNSGKLTVNEFLEATTGESVGSTVSFSLSEELSTLSEADRKEYEAVLSNLTAEEEREFAREYKLLAKSGAPPDECFGCAVEHYKAQKREKESLKTAGVNNDQTTDAQS